MLQHFHDRFGFLNIKSRGDEETHSGDEKAQ